MAPRTLGTIPREVIVITDQHGRLCAQAGIDPAKFEDNIQIVRDCVLAGRQLPTQFYRRSPGKDYLLEENGWMHLHVGHGIDDDVLLIVEAMDDRVLFIALTDHRIFKERPRGKSLRGLRSKIARAKAAEEIGANLARTASLSAPVSPASSAAAR